MPTIIINSRFNPKPYGVINLFHNDFMDSKTVQTNILLKQTFTDDTKIKISEVKRVLFTKKSQIIILRFSDDAKYEKSDENISDNEEREQNRTII